MCFINTKIIMSVYDINIKFNMYQNSDISIVVDFLPPLSRIGKEKQDVGSWRLFMLWRFPVHGGVFPCPLCCRSREMLRIGLYCVSANSVSVRHRHTRMLKRRVIPHIYCLDLTILDNYIVTSQLKNSVVFNGLRKRRVFVVRDSSPTLTQIFGGLTHNRRIARDQKRTAIGQVTYRDALHNWNEVALNGASPAGGSLLTTRRDTPDRLVGSDLAGPLRFLNSA